LRKIVYGGKSMFWNKNKDKLAGPKDIPDAVKKKIESTQMIDSTILPFLKMVMKNNEKNQNVKDILIYDPGEAEAREIKVQNYDTIKAIPSMIIAEGTLDESSKSAEITNKRTIPKVKFFTDQEILQQIEGLKDPGSSVFFFVNAGTGAGGPLGRGCAVVRVNNSSDGKKVKKYAIYGSSVIDMQPAKNESKIFDSDKASEVAKWISSSHKARFC
jgi:hypothetical protein